MNKDWIQAETIQPPQDVLDAAGGDDLLASILYRRGLTDPHAIGGFLNPDEYQPASSYELPGMAEGVARIQEAVRNHEKILIWGDFDVDGQTSTTILYQAFQALGAEVRFHIPLRETEGHGVHLATLQKYLQDGTQLVVTCDTGISENRAVQLAGEMGVDFIITDHHEIPEQLPVGAVAMINPRFLPEGHPLGGLPGCGVAYKLAEALLNGAGNPIPPQELLDLAALGIVADLAELRGDARYLLQRGLDELRRNKRLGLARLLQIIELDPLIVNEEHIAFYLAPRLNALGRLADANLAVDFFTTTDEAQAVFLAQELEGLNTRRKLLTDQVLQGALSQIEQHPAWSEDPILVVEHPDWPGGVLGIVASQLVNRFAKPAILLQTNDGRLARGSARSVAGINITGAITAHRQMLSTFGGHPMAAGLSMAVDRVAEFRQVINHTIAGMALMAPPPNQLVLDAEIPLSELALETAERLNRLSPFGQGNPAPILVTPSAHVVQSTAVGKFKEHLTVRLEDPQGTTLDAIWWQGAGQPLPENWFQLAYTVRTTTFRGAKQLQVEWLDAREMLDQGNLPEIISSVQIFDYRGLINSQAQVEELRRTHPSIYVFAEADGHALVKGKDRTELNQADCLVLFTLPPGSDELQIVLKTVAPVKIFLLGVDPKMDVLELFVRRLVGVMRFMASSQGKTLSIQRLAAATAQKSSTVELGLKYLVAKGELLIRQLTGDSATIEWVQAKPGIQVNEAAAKLERSLSETAAFRRNLMNMSVDEWRMNWFK